MLEDSPNAFDDRKTSKVNVDAFAKQYSSDVTQKSHNPLSGNEDNEGYDSAVVLAMQSDSNNGARDHDNNGKALTDIEEDASKISPLASPQFADNAPAVSSSQQQSTIKKQRTFKDAVKATNNGRMR